MLLTGGDDGTKLTNEGVPGPIGTATTSVSAPSASNAPVARLIIEKIGVDAPVITLGVDDAGIPEVPDNPYDVVWYNWSSMPGQGSNAVFAGHFDWTVNGQPVIGVFYSLANLSVGDIIEVKLEDGTDYKYSVIGNLAVPNGDQQAMELDGAHAFRHGHPHHLRRSLDPRSKQPPRRRIHPPPGGAGRAHRRRASTATGDGNIGQPRQEDSQG